MPSPIPVKVLPIDPESDTYQIALPTRFSDDQNIVAITYPKEVPVEQAIADIHKNNPRDSADTQIQQMLDPEYRKNMPMEDFKEWKKDKRAMEGTQMDVNYFGLAYDAAKAFVKGGAQTVAAVAGADPSDPDIRKQQRDVWNAIEGGLQGTERLLQLGKMAATLANRAITFDTDKTDQIEYDLFQQQNNFVDTMQRRGAGDLITADIPKGTTPEPTKEDIEQINSISNFLDATTLLPGVNVLEKMGQKMAANSVLKYAVPKYIAGTIAPKLAFGAAEYAGKALDYGTKLIINQVDKAIGAVAANAETKAAQVIAGRAIAFGMGDYALGGSLIGSAIAGKGLRAVGEIGGAVSEAMAKGQPVRGALREVAETTSSDVVRGAARFAVKLAPPEAAFDAFKHTAGAAFDMGLFMGGIGAMQAYAAQDDPIHGFMEGFASGAGVGSAFGAVGARGAAKDAKFKRLAEYFDNDLRSRPPQVAIDVNGQQVPINDLEGRVALFNRDDLSPEQKGFILSLTQAHEKSGNSVYFHDGSPEMLARLEAAGIGAGEGVQFFDGPDGRSTVVMDASALNPGTAVEEVFHGMVSDSVIKEIGRNINLELKAATAPEAAVDPTLPTYAPRRSAANKARGQEMLNDLQGFADRYIDLLEKSGTESGRAKAAEYRSLIYRVATDPNMMPDIKTDILAPILNEYGANYARAKLAGMRLPNLMEGNIRNLWDSLWDKTMGNLLSSLDASKIGAKRDPITGHFFNEKGKRVINPTLERMVDRFLEAASEGRKEIPAENTTSGTYYFDVRSDKPFVSYEDMIDGKQTTPAQKRKIHNEMFKLNAEWLNANSPVDNVVLVTDRLKYEGAFHGNITKMKSGKDTLIFSQNLPEAFFDHLAETEQITPEQAKILKYINRSMVGGQIVTVDSWADIGKHKGDRSLVYYGRGNRAFLPVSFQQGPTGGFTVSGLDVTRVWDYAKRASKKVRAVREEFRAKGIDSMQEFLPYMQRYFDNYSSDNPIPAAELKDFSPAMRDVISMALSDSIGIRDYFEAEDKSKFQNLHTFSARLVGKPEASVVTKYRRGDITHAEMNRGLEAKGARRRVVPLGGDEAQAIKAVKMARESVSLLQLRADRLLGLSDFSINNAPFVIRYNPYKVTNLVRANFSPGRTINETIGDSQVITDAVNGKRMIVKPNGKVTLFDGESKSIHNSIEEAQDFANSRTNKQDIDVDVEYLNLAKDPEKNNAALRRIIETEAEKSGYNSPTVFHGSIEKGLTRFDVNKAMEVEGAIFFTTNEDVASQYTYERAYGDIISDQPLGDITTAKLRIENPLEYKSKGRVVDAIEMGRAIDFAKANNHDGVVIRNIDDSIGMTGDMGDVYVVFNSNQIKSVSPLTYSNSGEIIPPSQRFNKRTDDIRFSPRRKKDAIESTDNAFNDPTNSIRALSDKAARLYRDGHLEIGELNKILVTLNQRQGKSTTEARKEAALFVADAVRGLKPAIIEPEKTVQIELPPEEKPQITYEGMTHDEAVSLKLLNKNGTVSISKVRKYHAEKARQQRELDRVEREKNAEIEALNKKQEADKQSKEKERLAQEAENAKKLKKAQDEQEKARLRKEKADARDDEAAKAKAQREYDATTRRIEQMIRDDNEKAYLEREKIEANFEKRMERIRARARKIRAKTMENLLKEQDQSYDAYVKEFFVQEAKAEKEAMVGSAERRKAGEEAEVAARKQRTAERAAGMKSLLEARDAQAAEDAATVLKWQNRLADQQTAMQDRAQRKAEARDIAAQEKKVEQMPPISDPRIPEGARITFTPSRKFKVYYSGAGLVGITDDFESALKLSNKYATRKVAIR